MNSEHLKISGNRILIKKYDGENFEWKTLIQVNRDHVDDLELMMALLLNSII